MREIKFRGKRLDNGEWVYGSLIKQYKKPHKVYIPFCPCIYVNEDNVFEVQTDTVGQYTGFNDSNGIYIYEGDFINMKNLSENVVSEVKFDSGMFALDDWGEKESLYNALDGYLTLVCGNIHDNPFLLSHDNPNLEDT